MFRARSAAWAALIVTLAAGPAEAQSDDEETPPEAVEFYRQAREHYESGQYQDAADDLERALMLDPDSPTLVYNLARVYELLGEPEQALRQYERYQQLLPQQQAREQDRAAATIRRLQGAAASTEPADQLAAPREVAPLRQLPGLVLVRENGVADGVFWGVLAVGASALVAGAAFGGVALDARGQANDVVLREPDDLATRNSLIDNANGFAIAADIALPTGGAAVIAAGLLYFLREHTVERPPIGPAGDGEGDGPQAQIEPLLGPTSAGLQVRGRL